MGVEDLNVNNDVTDNAINNGGENTTPPAEGVTSSPGEGAGTEAPAYTPNFKYKVMKEEKEIPEWVRGVVTDPEKEKTVRDLFERADGIEPVKAHRDQLLQESETYKREVVPFMNDVNQALDFAAKKDFTSFFEKVGIAEDDVLKHAIHILQLREDPTKAAAHVESRTQNLRTAELETQLQAYQAGYQNLAVQQREFELTSHLGRAEIQPTVVAFEAVQGPGAFRNEVLRRAQYYASQGTDIPVETVVSEVAKIIGWQGQKTEPPVIQTPPAEPGQRKIPPSLPNIQAKGNSPAKRVARSVADLREIGRAMKK